MLYPLSIDQMAANIEKTISRATSQQVDEGENWYRTAHQIARSLAETHWGNHRPRNVRAAAGVIAALSPNVPWTRNVQLAYQAFAQNDATGTYTNNCSKANAILQGDRPEQWLSGPKVTAFYECIVRPDNCTHVVVDRHAAHVAWGQIVNDTERNRRLRVTNSRNEIDRIVTAYRIVADRYGLLPCQAQAIAWVVHRDQLEGRAR